MNKIRYFLAIGVMGVLMSTSASVAEEIDVSNLSPRERTFVGGFLGLQVGSAYTTVSINLHTGYRLTNRLTAGLGGNYQYVNDTWFGDSFSSHTYGANLFARFRVRSHFFLHAETERLWLQSRPDPFDDTDPDDRPTITEDNYFLGAGYAFPVSDRVRLNLLLLYNFNDNSQAYRDNPVFRVGVDVFL